VIENWAPLDEITPMPRDTAWAVEHDLEGKTRFMYSGTLGMKHRPELLLDLARRYQSRHDVCVVVIAQGAGADWLRERAGSIRPGVLQVLPFEPYEKHSEVLASADVLITLLDDDCGAFAVPSKTLAYMCAGRSLLVAAPADNLISTLLERSAAGVATSPNTEPFLAGAESLLADHERRITCGENARAYAARTFCIDTIYSRFMQAFAFALRGQRSNFTEAMSREIASDRVTYKGEIR
jgi:glycosyltransferase involved in cell wall biosynthesis